MFCLVSVIITCGLSFGYYCIFVGEKTRGQMVESFVRLGQQGTKK
jgi:hypothetical protein